MQEVEKAVAMAVSKERQWLEESEKLGLGRDGVQLVIADVPLNPMFCIFYLNEAYGLLS